MYKINPGGTLTNLYDFCAQFWPCVDGYVPQAALILAIDGSFYGTTWGGGANGIDAGTVFKIAPNGTLTTLYNLCSESGCADGQHAWALVQGTNGLFYGTAINGGVNGDGTLFKMTASGTLTTLYSFCSQSNCADGENPSTLLQASDGNFYGTMSGGGANGGGTVFKMAPSGTLTTLYSFCSQSGCTDGEYPGQMIQSTDGNFYGITSAGGPDNVECSPGGCGTIFKLTLKGTLTTLYDFCAQAGCADGLAPNALIQATDGNFYGTTNQGGDPNQWAGVVFRVMPDGTMSTLHTFCSQGTDCADGFTPTGLVQDTNGTFYGTTSWGGVSGGWGTVYSLSVGLGPFVETLPTYGRVGQTIKILGTNLAGATAVTFNGTPASFNLVRNSVITATVPGGATTGIVQVSTPGGTLSSNVPFRVAP